jgi:hypothetical protein
MGEAEEVAALVVVLVGPERAGSPDLVVVGGTVKAAWRAPDVELVRLQRAGVRRRERGIGVPGRLELGFGVDAVGFLLTDAGARGGRWCAGAGIGRRDPVAVVIGMGQQWLRGRHVR